MLRHVLACLLFSAAPVAASAAMYGERELSDYRARAEAVLNDYLHSLIVESMPREQRSNASEIRLLFEASGPTPLTFAADPKKRTVNVPVETIRFLDDLFTLQAWFRENGCREEYVVSYLSSLLGERRPMAPPLEAFAIARATVLDHRSVAEASNEALKGAVLFLLSHEVGHLVLEHAAGRDTAISREQEAAADAFALDRFATLGVEPASAVDYFAAAAWLDPALMQPEDGTHPMSGARLTGMAERLAACPECFASSYREPLVTAGELGDAAVLVGELGAMIQQPEFRQGALALRVVFPSEDFPTACPG